MVDSLPPRFIPCALLACLTCAAWSCAPDGATTRDPTVDGDTGPRDTEPHPDTRTPPTDTDDTSELQLDTAAPVDTARETSPDARPDTRPRGCREDSECRDPLICEESSGRCRCPSEHHLCGGRCVSDDSVDHCGTRCQPCPPPPLGNAVCRNERCEVVCPEGYRSCGGVCRRCPSSAETTTCSAGECIASSCPEGKVKCGGRCAVCPEPAVAYNCSTGKCVVTACPEDFHKCSGRCVRNDSPTHCGASCKACPAVPGGAPTCVEGSCGFRCKDGYYRCDVGCCRWKKSTVATEALLYDIEPVSAGQPAVGYFKRNHPADELWFAEPTAGGGWRRQKVDAGVDPYGWQALVQGADGRPAILHRRGQGPSYRLYEARRSASGDWSTHKLDVPVNGTNFRLVDARSVSATERVILVADLGNSRVGQDPMFEVLVGGNGAWRQWSTGVRGTGQSAEIAVDPAGREVHVLAPKDSRREILHLRRGFSAGGWTSTLIVKNQTRTYAAMALDRSDAPTVVHVHERTAPNGGLVPRLMLAEYGSGGWSYRKVLKPAQKPDLTIGPQGRVHLGYLSNKTGFYAVERGGRWRASKIAGQLTSLFTTRVVVDDSGTPWVFWAESPIGGELRVAR